MEEAGVGLIGREREHADLRALVARHRVVFVYGVAGVGKTSLVLDVCRAAARERAVPEVVHLPIPGTLDARDVVERTAKAIGEPRPTPAPERVGESLSLLLSSAPRTVVWDDIDERSTSLIEIVKHFAAHDGPARLVLISRRFVTSREASLRTPVYEVKPLSHDGAVQLVRALEAERGRTLADDLADATAGNPLLLRLALAEEALPRVAANATDALRRSVEERASGLTRKVLALLAAAGVGLDENEVVKAGGKTGREAVDDLRKHLLVVRDGARIALAAPVLALAQETLGEPEAATWRTLVKLGEHALATSGHDDSALLLTARAHLALHDVEGALRILREHAMARAAAPTAALERVLRAVASQAPAHASIALRLLARELLRVGDYDSARRALDELPAPRDRDEAERVALLRAESHIRAGEPHAAQRALDTLDGAAKTESSSPGVVLTRAQLGILRGELGPARATLEKLAKRTAAVPQLEARRAVEIAASHLYEERYAVTHAWTSRARAAQKAGGIPVERVVTILDVHALLGLGDVDRAEEVLARDTRGRPDPPLDIAALVRRGELVRALEVGDVAIASLDRRADLLFRSVLARDLARACIGTGELERADKMLRLAENAGNEPGLAALGPICDAERARLAEAEGDLVGASRSIERAYARIPGSPFVAIDRDVMNGRMPGPLEAQGDEELPAVARAYATLRGAELSLADGALDDALEAADLAEHYYATAHLWHETARARIARAEALVRSHGASRSEPERAAIRDRALRALDACEEIAAPRGYLPIVVACGMVRAALEESTGDLEAARRAIAAAVLAAGEGCDGALARAARRLGAETREPRGAPNPYAARVERLGLVRSADVVWRIGARRYLRQAA
ncbi:MAG TPA: ATP-binding protein, partial [Labilithrix sp.]|nr:ATP-binding protein [Labilithrix sp.]